jgi:hypothetical protein
VAAARTLGRDRTAAAGVVVAVTGERTAGLGMGVHVCLLGISDDGNDTSLVSSVNHARQGRRGQGTMGACRRS